MSCEYRYGDKRKANPCRVRGCSWPANACAESEFAASVDKKTIASDFKEIAQTERTYGKCPHCGRGWPVPESAAPAPAAEAITEEMLKAARSVPYVGSDDELACAMYLAMRAAGAGAAITEGVERALAERIDAQALAEIKAMYADLRQLQDGFMNSDPQWTEWDQSVRQRLIAWGVRYMTIEKKLSQAISRT